MDGVFLSISSLKFLMPGIESELFKEEPIKKSVELRTWSKISGVKILSNSSLNIENMLKLITVFGILQLENFHRKYQKTKFLCSKILYN